MNLCRSQFLRSAKSFSQHLMWIDCNFEKAPHSKNVSSLEQYHILTRSRDGNGVSVCCGAGLESINGTSCWHPRISRFVKDGNTPVSPSTLPNHHSFQLLISLKHNFFKDLNGSVFEQVPLEKNSSPILSNASNPVISSSWREGSCPSGGKELAVLTIF